MSPRKNSRQRPKERPAGDPSYEATEDAPDGEWHVRMVSAAGAAKTYRCPGCDQEIPPGRPHLVAWRADLDGDDRRHWHRPCWEARTRRAPRVRRSRDAPRF